MRAQGLVVAALALLLAGCKPRVPEPAPAATPEPPPELPAALVIAKNAEHLMGIPGVVGVYEGQTNGKPVLRVMVLSRADSTISKIPKSLEGYPVEIEVSGPVKPMRK